MIISHSRKFIFIHLEKCGGTSIETALEPYLAWDDIILGSTDYGEGYQALLYKKYGLEYVQKNMLWKHSDANDIYKYLGRKKWNEYKKIVVVRNPIDMMQSLYYFSQKAIRYHTGRINDDEWKQWVIENSYPDNWPYVEKYVQAYIESKVRGKGFDGFVSILLDADHNFTKPQLKRIKSNPFFSRVDKIIDLSQLDSRWDEITDFIGITEPVSFYKLNISERDYDISMSEETEKRIRKHFAHDFRYMQYFTNVQWQ